MFDDIYDDRLKAEVEAIARYLSNRHYGSFCFVIPTYMDDGEERPCGDLDSYVRVYTPDSGVSRASPPFGTVEEWREYGSLLVTKPLLPGNIGQGAIIPIKTLMDVAPGFDVIRKISDCVRQGWYEKTVLQYMKQIQSKLEGDS